MIEGSGSVSGRPKNVWIRNTGSKYRYGILVQVSAAVPGGPGQQPQEAQLTALCGEGPAGWCPTHTLQGTLHVTEWFIPKWFILDAYSTFQCSGYVTFWCWSASGSADPYLWLTDPDPLLWLADSDPEGPKICIDTSQVIRVRAETTKNRLSNGKKRNKLSCVYVLEFRYHMARLEEDLKAILSSSK